MQPHSTNEVDVTLDGSDRAAVMLLRLIVIGGAQGSTDAARRILKGLPSTLPAPVIVVMHAMPGEQSDGSDGLAGERFPLPTRIATAGHRIAAGEVLSTPTGCHVQVVEGGTIEIDGPKLVCTSRSAVDMLFESAAALFQRGVISVVLSGRGDDGTDGSRSVKAGGGITVVQSPSDVHRCGEITQREAGGVLSRPGLAARHGRREACSGTSGRSQPAVLRPDASDQSAIACAGPLM
jgi:two-component system, chemotaxis family, protein-glutamate methylesterase/glutaminase